MKDSYLAEAAPLKALASLKANVWLPFGYKKNEDSEEGQAICKMCKKEVKYCGNTTDLQNHLMRHHPNTYSAKSDPEISPLEKAFAFKLASNYLHALKVSEALSTFFACTVFLKTVSG